MKRKVKNFKELEVGCLYKSREGKEVKIISKSNAKHDPYRGDNGQWYCHNGDYFIGIDEESKFDLIERIYNDSK